jgi:hypothetical protein
MKYRRLVTRLRRAAAVVVGCVISASFVIATPLEAHAANQLPYYYLPWASGVSHTVTQGNNGAFSHTGLAQYAWDFSGDAWEVHAARAGYVSGIKDSYSSGGCNSAFENMANYLMVRSGDYDALYLHLAQTSVSNRVSLYQLIVVGAPVAITDSSGYVCPDPVPNGAHLHFMVQQICGSWWCQSVQSSFLDADVLRQVPSGVPALNNSYSAQGGPFTGHWGLRNANTSGQPDISFQFEPGGGVPIVGDWTGSGFTTPGVFREGHWYLRNSNTTGGPDVDFGYGLATDFPLVGDWTGQCKATPGIFRNGQWYLRNSNTTGGADISFSYGLSTDIPVVGDWTGQINPSTGCEIDTPGVFRNGSWYLRNSNTTGGGDIGFAFGLSTDVPLVGDWTGQCNQSTVGQIDTPGVFRGSNWYLRNSNTSGGGEISLTYRLTTDVPLVGDWTDQTTGCPWNSRFDTPGVGY